jgi:drug/metabolite transporter (DMT)-like permease
MHPLVMPSSARHRRTLTTPQLLRIAATILLTVAVVAALGVFGGSLTLQKEVFPWFSARGISLAVVGWATYALPLLALSRILSPASRPLPRVLSYVTFTPALLITALMSRPHAMTPADWKAVSPAEFVAASELTAYALLAFAFACAAFCALSLRRATPADDALIMLRRNTSRAILLALGSTLATLLLT